MADELDLEGVAQKIVKEISSGKGKNTIDLFYAEKQLQDNGIVLLILPKAEYSENLMTILKIVVKQNKSICYVSANKPEKTITKLFNENDIDRKKFLIIDCITGQVGKEEGKEGATIFIKSPADLTELILAVIGAINFGLEIVFIDSLSTFLVYRNETTVVKFTHNLISKLRSLDKRGIFVILKDDVGTALIGDLGMFVDRVIDVSGE